MSFYDDASLVFLPSGEAGKDGKAYSMKPTNGNGDFTFSRGSNLTATRVDSNGLIEKGRENLLLQSNQFDTTWVTTNASVTSGQTGYNGSSDAWLLEATNTASILYQNVSSSGVQTISVYAKAGTTDNLVFYSLTSPSVRAGFDLTSGSVNYELRNIDASIEDVGNGWHRCSMVFSGASTAVRIYPADSSLTATIGDNIYIQDAQLEQGLVATEYIESGATKGKAGILEDSPRFDYSGGASCASLILERSRTNEIGYSEYFEGWTPQGSPTITTNYGTSPEGLQNSSRLRYTTDSDYIETSVTNTSGVFTLYAKGTGNLILTDSGANASSTTALTSSYQRIELYFSTNTTTLQIKTDSSGLDAEVYAAQFENDTYPTSYIPNHSGGSVTREADDLNDLDISSMITSSSFTWFLDLNDYIGSDINQETIFLESSPNLKIQLRVRPDGYRFYYNNIAGGSTYPIAGSTTANKFCVSYDGNDYRLYVDGTLEATTRSVGDSGWDYIKNAIAASLPLKQMLLFPSKLSDAECITITS